MVVKTVVKETLRARQAEGTRQLLIATARELFTERGFAATSIEEIIQRAGVAKGALYHHFSGKNDLFRAVYDAVQADAVAGVVAAALAESEPWAAVRAGLSAFLDACLDPAFRRVVVLDSVGVLQQDVWDGGIEHNELPMLRTVLTPLVAADLLPGVGVEPLSTSRSAACTAPRCSSPDHASHASPAATSTPSSTRWSPASNPAADAPHRRRRTASRRPRRMNSSETGGTGDGRVDLRREAWRGPSHGATWARRVSDPRPCAPQKHD